MLLNGRPTRTIMFDNEQGLRIIDQTRLPFTVQWLALKTLADACVAISTMQVRGAPAIGAVAAFGMALAAKENARWEFLLEAATQLKSTRPTAINLAWAVNRQLAVLEGIDESQRLPKSMLEAEKICTEDVKACSAIGDYGLALIEAIAAKKPGQAVNVLTHCNAGWLATVDWGTALAPIYKAHEKGINIHVWVDETRPRNQGALLTAFELSQQGIANTLICDNAGGHLMQQGRVDLCLVGSDRTAANGDVCNKIGTYLKALAAMDNQIPFYVALPVSTIDWALSSGHKIPIEERDEQEVLTVAGMLNNEALAVNITHPQAVAANPAFDITPARLVSGLITELGIYPADEAGMTQLKQHWQSSEV